MPARWELAEAQGVGRWLVSRTTRNRANETVNASQHIRVLTHAIGEHVYHLKWLPGQEREALLTLQQWAMDKTEHYRHFTWRDADSCGEMIRRTWSYEAAA